MKRQFMIYILYNHILLKSRVDPKNFFDKRVEIIWFKINFQKEQIELNT